MRYFVVEGTFRDTITIDKSELQIAIADHLVYLDKGFEEKFILASGPKASEGGGIIIIKGQSLEEIENYLSKDPLKVKGVQDYKIVEFKLHKCKTMLKEWFG